MKAWPAPRRPPNAPVAEQPDFAAPLVRQDLLGDPDCGPPLRAYVALTDLRPGADLGAEDRWCNRYYWFLRFAHAHRGKFGYDAGVEGQASEVLAEVAQFDVDPSQLQDLARAARQAGQTSHTPQRAGRASRSS